MTVLKSFYEEEGEKTENLFEFLLGLACEHGTVTTAQAGLGWHGH